MKKQKTMKQEISTRLASNEWNHLMAKRVLEGKRKKNRVLIFSLSLSSVAAACILFLSFWIVQDRSADTAYETMISKQIEGTYTELAAGAKKGEPGERNAAQKNVQKSKNEKKAVVKESFEDILLTSETDRAIDDALAMR